MRAGFAFGILLVLGQSAWASGRVAVYIVAETDFYSQALRQECDAAAQTARGGIPVAEKNLGLEAGTIELHYGISTIPGPAYPNPQTPGTPNRWRYECLLEFTTKDKSVSLSVDSTKMRTHLKKEEQASACLPDLAEIAGHPGLLFSQYEMSGSLFQGRICDVGYVEATKKQQP